MRHSLALELHGEELRRRVLLFRSGYHPDHSEPLNAKERDAHENEEVGVYLTTVVRMFLNQCGSASKGHLHFTLSFG
jgi:hypothetical protein